MGRMKRFSLNGLCFRSDDDDDVSLSFLWMEIKKFIIRLLLFSLLSPTGDLDSLIDSLPLFSTDATVGPSQMQSAL